MHRRRPATTTPAAEALDACRTGRLRSRYAGTCVMAAPPPWFDTLDSYLAAVARELQQRGVITGSPRRTDPPQRPLGSIVLDCTAVRVTAWAPADQRSAGRSLGGAVHPERPAPVIVTWDEDLGWCVGLHHDATRSTRRYLHSTRLPAPAAVAEFVVGLALGPVGAARPLRTRQVEAVDDPAIRGADDPGQPGIRAGAGR